MVNFTITKTSLFSGLEIEINYYLSEWVIVLFDVIGK